jgi:phosphoglycolate phosphatase-like HAD superfamily hydrolase
MPIRAVLFDIDGTLVDSNDQHVNAWAFAFRDIGRPQELDDIGRQIGKAGELLIPALAPDLDAEAREALSAAHDRYFKDLYFENVRAFPCATDLARRIHRDGRKVVLASSAKSDELDHYAALLGIADILDAATSSEDVETSKPAPDIFAAALERVGCPAEEAIAIGDTIWDVQAAARAGIATIGLTSGVYDETALRDAGAVAVFADVAALLAGIDRTPLSNPLDGAADPA